MQCNQPGFANGYPYQCFYHASSPPLQYPGPCPEIVGEGDVTSVMYPDGNVQYFFVPTEMRWPYNPYHPFAGGNAPKFVWSVRKVSNVYPCSNQLHNGTPQHRRICNSDYNVSSTGYQLKFHNDGCTSTSDLHVFCPGMCRFDPFPTAVRPSQISTCVQVAPVHSYYSGEDSSVSCCCYKSSQSSMSVYDTDTECLKSFSQKKRRNTRGRSIEHVCKCTSHAKRNKTALSTCNSSNDSTNVSVICKCSSKKDTKRNKRSKRKVKKDSRKKESVICKCESKKHTRKDDVSCKCATKKDTGEKANKSNKCSETDATGKYSHICPCGMSGVCSCNVLFTSSQRGCSCSNPACKCPPEQKQEKPKSAKDQECECPNTSSTSEKMVTTVTERGCGCTARECSKQTDTVRDKNTSKKKRSMPRPKKRIKNSSSSSINNCKCT